MVGMAILAACSTSKKKELPEEIDVTRKDQSWTQDLPVAAGTTLSKEGRLQRIRLTRVSEVRDAGKGYWVAGLGFAKVNDSIQDYFWNSPTPPHLEVTIDGEKLLPKASECRAMFDEAAGTRAKIEVRGEGEFSPEMRDGKYLGVFRLKRATFCSKLSD